MVKLREPKPTKKGTITVVKCVAAQLGNTPAVCRKSYIHRRVLTSYMDGSLKPTLGTLEVSIRAPEMYAVEGVVLMLLEEWASDGISAIVAAGHAVRVALAA
jgi:DNA topoisomerase-1